jgi:hypothetical protein
MIRIENGENVRDRPVALVGQFRDAADREHLNGYALHETARSIAEMGQKP